VRPAKRGVGGEREESLRLGYLHGYCIVILRFTSCVCLISYTLSILLSSFSFILFSFRDLFNIAVNSVFLFFSVYYCVCMCVRSLFWEECERGENWVERRESKSGSWNVNREWGMGLVASWDRKRNEMLWVFEGSVCLDFVIFRDCDRVRECE
jgi:hypothetical protein